MSNTAETTLKHMTKNEHLYAICYGWEVAGYVFSGESVKTVERYGVLNLVGASFSSFRDIKKNHFLTAAADIDDSISENAFAFRLKIFMRRIGCSESQNPVRKSPIIYYAYSDFSWLALIH